MISPRLPYTILKGGNFFFYFIQVCLNNIKFIDSYNVPN